MSKPPAFFTGLWHERQRSPSTVAAFLGNAVKSPLAGGGPLAATIANSVTEDADNSNDAMFCPRILFNTLSLPLADISQRSAYVTEKMGHRPSGHSRVVGKTLISGANELAQLAA
jgi:hypothetical protein